MRGNTILVFGISGVGKTTSCRLLVQRHSTYLYMSASELLRDATALDTGQLRTSAAGRILQNQSLLGAALRARREGHWDRPVLIDAHSVIDNDLELVVIPVGVIASLEPDGLILLEASPKTIAMRRAQDGSRRPQRSIEDLAIESEVAREAVVTYSRELHLPLEIGFVDEGFRLEGLVDVVTRQIRRSA
jgi:adenylate kinase